MFVAPGSPEPLPTESEAIGVCAAVPTGSISSGTARRRANTVLVFIGAFSPFVQAAAPQAVRPRPHLTLIPRGRC